MRPVSLESLPSGPQKKVLHELIFDRLTRVSLLCPHFGGAPATRQRGQRSVLSSEAVPAAPSLEVAEQATF